MGLNKELFVMLTFFVSIIALIALVVGSNITVSNNNFVTYGAGNITVLNPSAYQQASSTCNNVTSLPIGSSVISSNGNGILNFFNAAQQFVDSVGTTVFNGFGYITSLLTNGALTAPGLSVGNSATTVTNNAQCGIQLQTQQNVGVFEGAGFLSKTTSPIQSITGLITTSLLVAAIFIGLGLLAGTFGAGQLAPIVTAMGLGVSLITFMQGVLSSPYFGGVPFMIQVFIDAITGAMFVWIVIVLLRD